MMLTHGLSGLRGFSHASKAEQVVMTLPVVGGAPTVDLFGVCWLVALHQSWDEGARLQGTSHLLPGIHRLLRTLPHQHWRELVEEVGKPLETPGTVLTGREGLEVNTMYIKGSN